MSLTLVTVALICAPSAVSGEPRGTVGPQAAAPVEAIEHAKRAVVKVFGAGGLSGLEAYQSGIVISGEGEILTVSSHVLAGEAVRVVLDDGRAAWAEPVARDPKFGLALLKADLETPYFFRLEDAQPATAGTRVLALSNLFSVAQGNEPVSAQHGMISTVTPLDTRVGAFETSFPRPVYLLDAMTNNPGAGGGALVAWDGRLVGLLSKEIRSAQNGTWINVALPAVELVESVRSLLARRPAEPVSATKPPRAAEEPWSFGHAGFALVPEVLDATPPYVDEVRPDSPAAEAGLRADDLLLMIDETLVDTCADAEELFSSRDRRREVRLLVERQGKTIELRLSAIRGGP